MWIECYEPDRKQQELAGAIFDNVRAAQVFKEAMASTGKGRWEDFEAIKIDFPVGKMVWLIPDPPSVEPNAIDQCQFKEVEGYVVVSGPGVDGILKKSGGAWYVHFPIKGGYEENWISVFTKMSKALNDHLVEAKDPKTDLTVLKRKILTEANAE